MLSLGQRPQRTLREPSPVVAGTGLLTGADVRLRFRPADAGVGIVFVRTDLRPLVHLPARAAYVTGTARRTTIGRDPAHVALVEHVLAALHGMRIDNCYVEIDGPEPPGLDGSARGFVEAIVAAGIDHLDESCEVWTVARPITVRQNGASLTLYPAESAELRMTYLLDYGPGSPIDRQSVTLDVTPGSFRGEIAASRTFLLQHEAEAFRRAGIGAKTTPRDVLVFGPRGPIDNRLHSADEPARHKILDLIGDLALGGLDVRGHFVGYRSGHPLNVDMARALSRGERSALAGPCRRYRAAA